MKAIILALFTTLTFASNCQTYEAQTIGKITAVKKLGQLCHYSVDITTNNEHILCPLYTTVIESKGVISDCGLKTGQRFGKVIVHDLEKDILFFD